MTYRTYSSTYISYITVLNTMREKDIMGPQSIIHICFLTRPLSYCESISPLVSGLKPDCGHGVYGSFDGQQYFYCMSCHGYCSQL